MKYLFAILICLISLSISAQDKLQIRNFGAVNGLITSFSRDHVFLKVDSSTKKLRYDVIESIKMQDPERLRSEIVLYRQAALLVYGRYVNLTFAEKTKMDSVTNAALADNSSLSNQLDNVDEGKKYWTSANYLYEAGRMEHNSFWYGFGGAVAISTSFILAANKNYAESNLVSIGAGILFTASVVCRFRVGTYLKLAGVKATEKLSLGISPTSATFALQF